MNTKERLKFGRASLAILLCTAFPATALAQAVPADATAPEEVGDNIVVTARRQNESLQDTPLTITAITGEGLARAGARDLRDISFLTPGLIINPASGETQSSPVMRGLVSLGGSSSPTVAVFFDGAYLGGTAATSINLLDLERVEVVKGPVNSLYGRAAYAGAINYISVTPSDPFALTTSFTVGNQGQRKFNGVIGGGLVPGLLAVRVAAGYEGYNGGYTDQVNGLKAGDFEKRDAQISFKFTPSDTLTTTGRVYYGDDRFGTGALGYVDNNCGTSLSFAGQTAQRYFCGQYDPKQHAVEVAPESRIFSANDRTVLNSFTKTVFEAAAFDVSSITAYTRITSKRLTDFIGKRDGVALDLVAITPKTGTLAQQRAAIVAQPDLGNINLYQQFGNDQNIKDFSQELRFSAKSGERLRWNFGGYYAKTTQLDSSLVGLDSNKIPAGLTIRGIVPGTAGFNYLQSFLTPGGGSNGNNTVATLYSRLLSGFAGTDFDLTSKLTFTAEARYTSDKRRLDALSSNQAAFAGIVRPFGMIPGKTFGYWNGRLSAQYKFTPAVMVYATFADGVKSGGFNTNATIDADRPYDVEKNDTYEVGIKTTLFDRKLFFNASAFYVKLEGLQLSGPAQDPLNAGFVTKNVGGATSKGFEFDFSARPLTGLRIGGGASFTVSKFDSSAFDATAVNVAGCTQTAPVYCDLSRIIRVPSASLAAVGGTVAAVSLDGLYVPQQPKWTATLEANYTAPLNDEIDGFFNAQYRFQSRQYGEPTNLYWNGPLNRVNLRAGITRDQLSLTAFVDNVFDDDTPDRVYRSSPLNTLSNIYSGAMPFPRRYGLTMSYKY